MDSVYQPAEDSYLLKEAIEESDMSGDVLDMGTGSGILAIAAANKGCNVTAVDINPEALEVARENAKGLDIKFILSDLFKEVTGKYDWMIFNTPYVPTEESEKKDMQSRAWDGGKDGLQVAKEFLRQSREFLKPGGKILLLVSSNDNVVPNFSGFKDKVLKKKSMFFEQLYVLELHR